MSDILLRICAETRQHVARCKRERPADALRAEARAATPPRGFVRTLHAAVEGANRGGPFGLIAEIKKASPSAGLIRPDFDPVTLARAYARGGANCLSVLTDEPFFQGSTAYLTAARNAVDLPVLRKDFVLDPYQVIEARAIGADAVLLIMAALDDGEARELMAAIRELGMDALVEVHDEPELDRALALDPPAIGINNRNLRTLAIDLATTERLAPRLKPSTLAVGESGIRGPADLERLARAGVGCFLVGESLMKAGDVEAATRALLDRGERRAMRA